MKITIILHDPYPHGMAATNRVHLYAKSLKERGHDVEIIIPRPLDVHYSPAKNLQAQGTYDDISFRYPSNPWRSKSFIWRRIIDVKAYFNTLSYLIKKRRDSDILLAIGIQMGLTITYKIFCLLFKCKFIYEKSELPLVSSGKNVIGRFYYRFYIKVMFNLFDGIITISDNLYDYFKKITKGETKVIIIPILGNKDDFNPVKENTGEILYTGTLNQRKDGVLDLLEAYRLFIKKISGKKLVLIGGNDILENMAPFEKFIEANNLSDSIEVIDYLDRPAMIRRMIYADVLVLAKPTGLQANHCMPTKLAEYLFTGKPVLVTNTGVIAQFLDNGKNVFLTEPDNPVKFSEALVAIFENYNQAQKVGEQGRISAIDQFDYRKQGDRLLVFFSDVLGK